MINFNKYNFIKHWWRSVDQQVIVALGMLLGFSLMLVTTTSSSIAGKIGLIDNYFSSRQVYYLIIASILLVICSSFEKKWIKRIGILGFVISIIMLILVKIYGHEIKGASRWLRIAGFSYQPSEFIKPFFSIVIGWILSLQYEEKFPSFTISLILYLIVATLLIIQPDFGMLVLITLIFIGQLFISGLPIIWIIASIFTSFCGIICAYIFLPHVATRINNFLDPNNEAYQVSKSLLAFKHGGLYGVGPGEGAIKYQLPDSHTDFIFAVAGEEFGAIICIIIISIFAFITLRILSRITNEKDKFVQLSAFGIITQFALQATINMCVTLNILPTKGMTLPFISYGGSSTLAISVAIGMLIGLTKNTTSLTRYKVQYNE